MNLHRTTGKPDWEMVAAEKRTPLQRLAFATGGVVTPANLISMIGFGLVVYGLVALLNQEYWLGLGLLGFGRLLDVVDGAIAQKTGTKSPLGEVVDAAIDKIGTILTILTFYVAGLSFWWLITALLLPQAAIALLVLYERSRGIKIHPTRVGKVSMATLWAALVGLVLLKASALTALHPMALLTYGIAMVSTALGVYAFWQYATGRD